MWSKSTLITLMHALSTFQGVNAWITHCITESPSQWLTITFLDPPHLLPWRGLPWWLCGLRHCHWLHPLAHHCLAFESWLGHMWESCQWLRVRQLCYHCVCVLSSTIEYRQYFLHHTISKQYIQQHYLPLKLLFSLWSSTVSIRNIASY